MVPPRLAMARPLLLAVCLSASWGIGGVDARHISRSTLASEVTVSVPAAEELMRLGSPAATYGGGTSRRQSSSIPPLESLQVAAALRRRQYDDGGGEEEGAPSFSCKEASFTGPRWYVYDPSYTVFNYSSGGRWGDVGFAGYHVATEVLAHCYAIGVNLAPVEGEDYWHDCREPPGTQFRFNLTAYTMEIRQNWTCDDAPG